MKRLTNTIKRYLFDFTVNFLASNLFTVKQVRKCLYRMAGLNIQTDKIKKSVYFHTKQVDIGKGSFINSFTKMFSAPLSDGKITIGENCYIGMSVLLCTHTHEVGDQKCRATIDKFYPIIINDGCWLGANVTVLPGVTIGEGCIIGAGAVVTEDCEPNGLYVGVPAKRKKDLDTVSKIKEII